MHMAARSKFRARVEKAPANRAPYIQSDLARYRATIPLAHRCPSLRSDNRQQSDSPTDDPALRGRPEYFPGRQVGLGKLPPADSRIPFAATAQPDAVPLVDAAQPARATHSNATES